MQKIELKSIPDDEILRRLGTLVNDSRRTEADLAAHIGEVEARRLYAREATSSMFAYCLARLHFSEHEAYLRIAAARASREHPVILDMLADGRLHLTAISLLAPHLTREDRDSLLLRAAHKTKREVEELLAEVAPRADVRPSIRRLPLGRRVTSSPATRRCEAPELGPEQVDSARLDEVVIPECAAGETRAAAVLSGPGAEAPADSRSRPDTHKTTEVRGGPEREGAAAAIPGVDSRPRWAAQRNPSARIEPVSPARYRVQFTASTELRNKLERLRALMRCSIPDGDLATIIDAAVTEKLERLEARRFGQSKAPRKQLSDVEKTPSTRHVPAAVRRAVHDRDDGRCRYVDAEGRRCTARTGLEFHHRHPFAVGGGHSLANVSLQCRSHNQFLARADFGAKAAARRARVADSAASTPTQLRL